MSRGRVGDIIGADEARSRLISRGFTERDATEATAFRVFMSRLCRADLEPGRADADYRNGTIGGRAYLEQVAPEELTDA